MIRLILGLAAAAIICCCVAGLLLFAGYTPAPNPNLIQLPTLEQP